MISMFGQSKFAQSSYNHNLYTDGVLIDSKLSFEQHIASKVNKTNSGEALQADLLTFWVGTYFGGFSHQLSVHICGPFY